MYHYSVERGCRGHKAEVCCSVQCVELLKNIAMQRELCLVAGIIDEEFAVCLWRVRLSKFKIVAVAALININSDKSLFYTVSI